MLARINSGFQNEHHWANWLRVNKKDIGALPVGLRNRVMLAYENATHVAFSKPLVRR